jgi:hypothetical protein
MNCILVLMYFDSENTVTCNCCAEWVSDYCLMPTQQLYSTISWGEQVNCQWDDDEVRFVLDQHA